MKKAIIVGASSGIGEEMAKQLSTKGYQLGLMARRIELLTTLNKELGGKHVVMQIDPSNFHDAEEKMKMMISELKDVDIIILNFGIGTQEYQLDWKYQKQVIDANVSGLVMMSTRLWTTFSKEKEDKSWNLIYRSSYFIWSGINILCK